jgi:hypothetical protein
MYAVAYLIGYLFIARRIALAMLESDARKELERRGRYTNRDHPDAGKPLVDGEQRLLAVTGGGIIAVGWPLALLVMLVAGSLRAPSEKLAAEREELAALRKLARDNNLPMPEVKP